MSEKKPKFSALKNIPILRNLTRNTGLKILSLVFAVIMWYVIISQTNPVRQKIIYDVPITITGRDQLIEKDLDLSSYPEELSSTVDITVSVPMDEMSRVTNNNVQAFFDLSSINATGTFDVELSVVCSYPNATPVDKTIKKVSLNIESHAENSVPVKAEYIGQLPDNLHMGDELLAPREIVVAGPKTVVDSVSVAEIDINLSTLHESMFESIPVRLMDANGKEVDQTGLSLTPASSVNVTIPVYPIQSFAINHSSAIRGEVQPGYEITQIEVVPANVLVAAPQNVLNAIAAINTKMIDVEGLSETTSFQIGLSKPSDVVWMDTDEAQIIVRISEVKTEKTFARISVEAINLAPEYEVELSDAVVDVVIQGPASVISQLQRSKIRAFVDLAGAKEGERQVSPVQIYIDNALPVDCSFATSPLNAVYSIVRKDS